MQARIDKRVLGFIQLQVGSVPVRIPLRSAEPPVNGDAAGPLAQFEVDGDSCAIAIREDPSFPGVEQAVREEAEKAVVHLSHKLLN